MKSGRRIADYIIATPAALIVAERGLSRLAVYPFFTWSDKVNFPNYK